MKIKNWKKINQNRWRNTQSDYTIIVDAYKPSKYEARVVYNVLLKSEQTGDIEIIDHAYTADVARRKAVNYMTKNPYIEECVICGRLLTDENRFVYEDEFGREREVSDCCDNPKCIDEYADRYGDSEPTIDYEELAQKQSDDLWEQEELFKN